MKEAVLLPQIVEIYGLEEYEISRVPAHKGGRNIAYTCKKEGVSAKIIRIAFMPDRSREDFLGEVEYIRYLYERGGSVSNVLPSKEGHLLEEIVQDDRSYFICLFEKGKGKRLVENHYQYREGVPLSEYFYNNGKVLGKLHQLSKEYIPVHPRYSFFDSYHMESINRMIPDSLSLLKEKLAELLRTLEGLDRNQETFGMVHFDFSDGNYTIDFDTGQITVFDFDNSCYCWYLYDLANLWTHGVGWVQFEPDVEKRQAFMDEYFKTVLSGYRSETSIEDSTLDLLPLFIQVVLLENSLGMFEDFYIRGEKPECDEELSYLVKCLEEDIPYKGFFDAIYSCEAPFQAEERAI